MITTNAAYYAAIGKVAEQFNVKLETVLDIQNGLVPTETETDIEGISAELVNLGIRVGFEVYC